MFYNKKLDRTEREREIEGNREKGVGNEQIWISGIVLVGSEMNESP